mgnify:CR=1 FL=1
MTSLNALLHIDQSALQHCALMDLTTLPRVGFRGAHSAEYLQARGFSVPQLPNRALLQADGSQVVRLSQTEYLLLGSLADNGRRIADEEARWTPDQVANYLLPRRDSHAWLQLSGATISQVMAKLCGVDLRSAAFPVGSVAQTSVARVNGIIVNTDALQVYDVLQMLFALHEEKLH